MDATFRMAGPGDLETILPMVREFWVIERLVFVEPEVRRALAGLLGGPEFGQVLLIERAGAPIGYLALTLGYSLEHLGRDAFVDELYIREEHRGIGSATARSSWRSRSAAGSACARSTSRSTT